MRVRYRFSHEKSNTTDIVAHTKHRISQHKYLCGIAELQQKDDIKKERKSLWTTPKTTLNFKCPEVPDFTGQRGALEERVVYFEMRLVEKRHGDRREGHERLADLLRLDARRLDLVGAQLRNDVPRSQFVLGALQISQELRADRSAHRLVALDLRFLSESAQFLEQRLEHDTNPAVHGVLDLGFEVTVFTISSVTVL